MAEGDTDWAAEWQTRWRELALCFGQTALYFPGRGSSTPANVSDEDAEAEAQQEAAGECAGCRAEFPCLQMGMGEPFGVWGGFVAENRAITRRWGHDCPACGAKIRKKRPLMFCSEECVETAFFAEGDELRLIEKRVDEINERASLQNKFRKEEGLSIDAADLATLLEEGGIA